jgi:antitoxin HigA-1
MRKFSFPHPGEILDEEFLKPLGITKYRIAKAIGVPAPRIGEIVAGKRSITADTGLRLSRFFGQSEWFWMGLQQDYDRAMAKDLMADALAAIVPWPGRLPEDTSREADGKVPAAPGKRGQGLS